MYDTLDEETSSLVDQDVTEISPPKSKINMSILTMNYIKSFIPPIVKWLPKYNRNKLQGIFILFGGISDRFQR